MLKLGSTPDKQEAPGRMTFKSVLAELESFSAHTEKTTQQEATQHVSQLRDVSIVWPFFS